MSEWIKDAWIWLIISPAVRPAMFVSGHLLATLGTLAVLAALFVGAHFGGLGRITHALLRIISGLVIGFVLAWFSAWALLTAALGLIDGPYREWLTHGFGGALSCVVIAIGTLLWTIVGLKTLVLAVQIVWNGFRSRAEADWSPAFEVVELETTEAQD